MTNIANKPYQYTQGKDTYQTGDPVIGIPPVTGTPIVQDISDGDKVVMVASNFTILSRKMKHHKTANLKPMNHFRGKLVTVEEIHSKSWDRNDIAGNWARLVSESFWNFVDPFGALDNAKTWFVLPFGTCLHNMVEMTRDPELSLSLFDIAPDLITLAHVTLKALEDLNIVRDINVPEIPIISNVIKLVDVELWTDERTGKSVTLGGLLLMAVIVDLIVDGMIVLIPHLTKEILTTLVAMAVSTSMSLLATIKSMKANKKLYGRFDDVDDKLLQIEGSLPKSIDYDRIKDERMNFV